MPSYLLRRLSCTPFIYPILTFMVYSHLDIWSFYRMWFILWWWFLCATLCKKALVWPVLEVNWIPDSNTTCKASQVSFQLTYLVQIRQLEYQWCTYPVSLHPTIGIASILLFVLYLYHRFNLCRLKMSLDTLMVACGFSHDRSYEFLILQFFSLVGCSSHVATINKPCCNKINSVELQTNCYFSCICANHCQRLIKDHSNSQFRI